MEEPPGLNNFSEHYLIFEGPNAYTDMNLLKQLCEIHAPSGEEFAMKEFLLKYIQKEKKKWKAKPEIHQGDEFQDCIVLSFGKPRTAVFAHMDSIGFTVRYFNQLLPIGSPDAEMGTRLVGHDSLGAIDCELEYDKGRPAVPCHHWIPCPPLQAEILLFFFSRSQ